jgi:hypothetical protein
MNEILNDSSQVVGQIYIITNIITNKKYIGQTLSHRKNHNKYRPFGYQGRFKDHISEAICNTKKKQCNYLNNSIREYGKDAFKIELIIQCNKQELDLMEQKYIKEYNTLYPNGYNLTIGGKVFREVNPNIPPAHITNSPKKRGGCISRSEETRVKMSESLVKVMGTPEARQKQMLRTQKQHISTKLNTFNGIDIDLDNPDQYITVINKKDGSKFIRVRIDGKKTSFVGKYQTLDELRERAIQFLKTVKDSATLPNCSGNP